MFLLVSLAAWGSALAQIHELGNGSPGPVKAAHLIAELVPGAASVTQGSATTVALALALDPGWHVYWANAGDSGQPPQVDWTLSPGLTAGPMQFPAPKRLPLGPLMDYGYEGVGSDSRALQSAFATEAKQNGIDLRITSAVVADGKLNFSYSAAGLPANGGLTLVAVLTDGLDRRACCAARTKAL